MDRKEIMEKFLDEEGKAIMEIKERTPEATVYRIIDRDILDYPLPYDKVEKLQHPDRDREIEDLFSMSIGGVEEVSIAHHEILVRKTPAAHWEEIDKTVLSLLKEIPGKEK